MKYLSRERTQPAGTTRNSHSQVLSRGAIELSHCQTKTPIGVVHKDLVSTDGGGLCIALLSDAVEEDPAVLEPLEPSELLKGFQKCRLQGRVSKEARDVLVVACGLVMLRRKVSCRFG